MWASVAIAATAVGATAIFLTKYSKPLPESTHKFDIFKKLKSPVHVSHRGGSSYAPQNTMYSFRKCVNEVLLIIIINKQ